MASYGQRLNVIVKYDNFSLNPLAADRFFAMVKHNRDHYLLSSTRYSTNAFFRHQLRQEFASASPEQRIYYASFDEAKERAVGGALKYASSLSSFQLGRVDLSHA